MTQRVNITELARLSGVSVGTVSRALNGYPDVNEATRERVMALAQELDYTPDAAARKLVTRRSHVVGVVLDTGEGHPDLGHPFFHEVLVGLKQELGARGFDLLLLSSANPGGGYGDHSYLKRCLHHGVEGVVLMGVAADDPEVERLARSSLPTVSVDLELAGRATRWVTSDSEGGAQLAVEHLAALGHRRIAHIAGPPVTTPGRARLNGFRRAIADANLPYGDDLVAYGDFYYDAGRDAMGRLLDLPHAPTAVFAASDMMAIGAMRAVHERGLSVPQDVSVVGFDDIPMAAMAHPPLTTIRQEKAEIGALASRTLIECIAAGDGADGDLGARAGAVPVALVERDSTAAVTAQREVARSGNGTAEDS
jgi:LacI family transcriptional regulator